MRDTQETGTVKIKELSIPEPVRRDGARFDPRSDIKTEDWDKILDLLQLYADPEGQSQTAFGDFLEIANNLKTISPERFPDAFQGTTYEQRLEDEISTKWGWPTLPPSSMTSLIRDAGMLYPQISRDKLMNQAQENGLIIKVQEAIDNAPVSADPSFLQALFSLADIKIFDPNLLNGFENVDAIVEMAKTVCKDQLDEFYKDTDDDPAVFLQFAPRLKILAPDIFKQLTITDTYWKNLKRYIEIEKEVDGGVYLYLMRATQLGIISATDIHFSGRSLQLVFDDNKPEFDAKPPMPEVRKF